MCSSACLLHRKGNMNIFKNKHILILMKAFQHFKLQFICFNEYVNDNFSIRFSVEFIQTFSVQQRLHWNDWNDGCSCRCWLFFKKHVDNSKTQCRNVTNKHKVRQSPNRLKRGKKTKQKIKTNHKTKQQKQGHHPEKHAELNNGWYFTVQ